MSWLDPFNDEKFSMSSLTAAINEIPHVPGRAGELVFTAEGVFKGVETVKVAIERMHDEGLTLIPTTTRTAPAPKEDVTRKRDLIDFEIPQIKLEDTIRSDSIQDVRMFGTENQLIGPEYVVNQQMQKMVLRHDLTLEHHRLGALMGQILDADGSVLTDLFATFGILNDDGFAEPQTFPHFLDSPGLGAADAIRIKCQNIARRMERKAKMGSLPNTALIWAFCGDDFFDTLISHPSVKEVWDGFGSAEAILRRGGNYAFGVFEFGGILWENYRGTDDQETVAIADDEARIFLTGVPGLYAEYFAPADFLDTVNTPGLRRYARLARDKQFNRWIEIHTQQNPLPLCLRPQTLMRATIG
jgi:hypothetical protein